jgi:hypothetical protein
MTLGRRPRRASARRCRRSAFAVALALTALCLAPAGAFASNADVAMTHRYLLANNRFVRTVTGNLRVSHAALARLLAKVRRECPRGAAGSPQNPESTALSNEVIGAMVFAGGRPDLPAAVAYVKAVKPMHWSDGRVTRAIQSYTRRLRLLTTIPEPPLCYDVKAWAAGGYKSLPPPTTQFDNLFVPNWVSAGILPAGLSKYESAADRRLAAREAVLEARIADFEAQEVETWGEIMNALELWP